MDIITQTASGTRKRRVVAAIGATGLLAALIGGYAITSAVFTDETTVGQNTVGTASLQIGDEASTTLSAEDLLPGETRDAVEVLTFKNTGTVPFTYDVSISDVAASSGAPSELPGWIPVTITAGGAADTGTLADPPALSVDSLAVGAAATVEVVVGLSEDASNNAQGRSVTFDLSVAAEQLSN